MNQAIYHDTLFLLVTINSEKISLIPCPFLPAIMAPPKAGGNWERFKDEIHTLYIKENRTLDGPDGVMKVMRGRYGFNAR